MGACSSCSAIENASSLYRIQPSARSAFENDIDSMDPILQRHMVSTSSSLDESISSHVRTSSSLTQTLESSVRIKESFTGMTSFSVPQTNENSRIDDNSLISLDTSVHHFNCSSSQSLDSDASPLRFSERSCDSLLIPVWSHENRDSLRLHSGRWDGVSASLSLHACSIEPIPRCWDDTLHAKDMSDIESNHSAIPLLYQSCTKKTQEKPVEISEDSYSHPGTNHDSILPPPLQSESNLHQFVPRRIIFPFDSMVSPSSSFHEILISDEETRTADTTDTESSMARASHSSSSRSICNSFSTQDDADADLFQCSPSFVLVPSEISFTYSATTSSCSSLGESGAQLGVSIADNEAVELRNVRTCSPTLSPRQNPTGILRKVFSERAASNLSSSSDGRSTNNDCETLEDIHDVDSLQGSAHRRRSVFSNTVSVLLYSPTAETSRLSELKAHAGDSKENTPRIELRETGIFTPFVEEHRLSSILGRSNSVDLAVQPSPSPTNSIQHSFSEEVLSSLDCGWDSDRKVVTFEDRSSCSTLSTAPFDCGFQQMFVKNGICTSDFDKSNNSVTLLSSQRKTCETMAPFPRTPTRVTRARRPRPRFIMQSVPVS